MERCIHCEAEVGERAGFENSHGEVLCINCFEKLGGARGVKTLGGEGDDGERPGPSPPVPRGNP